MLRNSTLKSSPLNTTTDLSFNKGQEHPHPVQSLTVRRGRASDAGNTLATAKPIGNKAKVRDAVSRSDKDIYKLTFTDLSDVRLTVENPSKANLSAVLLNSQGQAIASGQNRRFRTVQAGKTVKGLYEEVAAGTYYLRIESRGEGQNTYRLSVAATNTFPNFPPCGCADPVA